MIRGPRPMTLELTDAQHWLRWLVISAVLLLSALFGYVGAFVGPIPSAALFALLMGLVAVAILARWPSLGLAAVIAAGLLIPFSLNTGTASRVNAALLLVALLSGLWVLEMFARHDVRLLPSRPIVPLLAFGGVAGLSFLAGTSPWLTYAQTAPLPAQLGGLGVIWLSICAFLLAAHQVRDMRWLARLTWLFLILGTLYLVTRWPVGALAGLGNRLFPTGGDYSLFWTWLVALAGGQAMFNRSLRPGARLTLGTLALTTLATALVLKRSWVSGWLPGVAVLGTLVWLRSWRLAVPAAAVGLAGLLFVIPQLVGDLVAQKGYSTDTRLAAWQVLIENVIPISPLIGLGPANYHWYTPLFPINGYYVQFNSHNNYIDIVAQTGVIGLMCFAWFVWEIARLGWQLRAQATPGFGQAYAYAVLAGLVGTLVSAALGDWLLPFVYNIGLDGFRSSVMAWLFFGGLVALHALTNREAPRDAT